MKLHTTITSAYARKVWVVAHETGLISRIERIATNPHSDEYLREYNPLCRVPTLVLDDNDVYFDSRVICEYLDSLHDGPKLFPASGNARWQALRSQALGDGILDANVSRRNEVIRPPHEQSPSWIARQIQGVEAACAWLEKRIDQIRLARLNIGHIAIGCALGYFDVRFPQDTWRSLYPRLAAWHSEFEQRPSMVATRYATLKATLPSDLIMEGPSHH